MSADSASSIAGVVVANAVTSQIAWGPLPPATRQNDKPPHVAYLHDTRYLIEAIWPDAPPSATLEDIAAKARAHREIFQQYGALIAKGAFQP